MTTVVDQVNADSSVSKWGMVLSGAVAIAVGGFLLFSPAVSAAVLITSLGVVLIVMGLIAGIDALIRRGRAWGWRVAAGILSVVGGVLVLIQPEMAAIISLISLYFCLAFVLTAIGVIEIINGLTAPRSWGSVALGAIQLVLALLLLMNPVFGTLLVVPLIGLTTIALGIVLIAGVLWRPSWLAIAY